MKNVSILCDPLNLKDYVLFFSNWLKKMSPEVGIETTLDFITRLVQFLPSFEIQDSEKSRSDVNGQYTPNVKDLQKLFAGNISVERLRPLFSRILNGCFDDEIYQFFAELVDSITELSIFTELRKRIVTRFWDEEELRKVEEIQSGDTSKDVRVKFLFIVFLHGVRYPENIPAYTAKRLWEQGRSYDYDSNVRFFLFENSANLGSDEAGTEYANFLCHREDYHVLPNQEELQRAEKALEYFLSISTPYCLWNIAYLLKNGLIEEPETAIKHIDKRIELRNKLSALDKTYKDLYGALKNKELMPPVEKYVFDIHFVLAFDSKNYYPKSANNLANLVIQFNLFSDEESSDQLAIRFWKYAIRKSDIVSMSNLLRHMIKLIRKQAVFPSEDIQLAIELSDVLTAAQYPSAYILKCELIQLLNEKQNDKENYQDDLILLYYKEINTRKKKTVISNQDIQTIAKCYLEIGKLETEPHKKSEALSLGVEYGNADAAYYLADHYMSDLQTDKLTRIIKANRLLKEYRPNIGEELQKDVEDLARRVYQEMSIISQ